MNGYRRVQQGTGGDILFVVNVTMDYFLLRLVNRMTGGPATPPRALLGAMIGGMGAGLLTLLSFDQVLNTILAHVVINTMMVRFGCKTRGWSEYVRALLFLYLAAFLLGGAVAFVLRKSEGAGIGPLLLAGTISYLVLACGIRIGIRTGKKKEQIYHVLLCAGKRCRRGTALADTGNSLTDPLSGKPVNIVEPEFLRELLKEDTFRQLEAFASGLEYNHQLQGLFPHFIPYRSLGCPQGLLLAVTLDYLLLENQQVVREIVHPVIAVALEKHTFQGKYQMILHPNLIDE